MGRAAVTYRFEQLPSTFRYYPRAVFGKRAALCSGRGIDTAPRGRRLRRDRASSHIRRYRDVCGFPDDGNLPITYPHVLAMPLHVALLTHPRFLVRLMGLIHVSNEIHQIRPLPDDGSYRLRSWVEGHRDGDRGHEFDLFTECEDRAGDCLAREVDAARAPDRERRAGGPKREADTSIRKARRHRRAREGRHRSRTIGRPALRVVVRRSQPDPSR